MSLENSHKHVVSCFKVWQSKHTAVAPSCSLNWDAIGGNYWVTTTAVLAVDTKKVKTPIPFENWDKSQFDHKVGSNGKRVEIVKPSVLRASVAAHAALVGHSFTLEDETVEFQVKCEPRLVKSIMGETTKLSAKLMRASLCPSKGIDFLPRADENGKALPLKVAQQGATFAQANHLASPKVTITNKTLKPRAPYHAPRYVGLVEASFGTQRNPMTVVAAPVQRVARLG
jgi:hypothetical protein